MQLHPAPRYVFDRLPAWRDRPRFVVGTGAARRVVTWGELGRRVRQVARFVAARGLLAGERAAILADNRVSWIVAALGIQAAGAVVVPVHASSTAEQSAYVVQHSEAKLLFVDAAHVAQLAGDARAYDGVDAIVLLDDPTNEPHGAAPPPHAELPPSLARKTTTWAQTLSEGRARDEVDRDEFDRALAAVALEQDALLVYTSGTTGEPKGVPLTHGQLARNWSEWLQACGQAIPAGAVDALWLPVSHVFGFGEVWIGNALGFVTHLVEARRVIDELPSVRPSVLLAVPSLWEKLGALLGAAPAEERRARRATLGVERLVFCVSGGAALPVAIKERLDGFGLRVLEGYGLTETSPTLTVNRPDDFRFDSVGKALPSVELALAEDGEVLARGPTVFRGYHRDEASTRAAFTADGWFRTGDVGRFTDDGFLQLVDRKKDLLVTAGGKNVAPTSIEGRFADDPFIAHLVVYGDGRRYLVAGVWPDRAAVDAHLDALQVEPSARAAALHDLLQQRIDRVNALLPRHETLKRFVVLDAPLSTERGTLTATLKVRRRSVYAEFAGALDALYDRA